MSTSRAIALLGLVILCPISVLAADAGQQETTPFTFDGNSSTLNRTQIVPTLDTPIAKGKNAIWCATLPLAWKQIEKDITHEPLQILNPTPAIERLNESPDPRPDLPEGSFYTKAGWIKQGIIPTITADMKRLFPDFPMSPLAVTPETTWISYGCLQTQLKFTLRYNEGAYPLHFTDSAGHTTPLRNFGIGDEDKNRALELRKQPKFLYNSWIEPGKRHEFAVDLCADSQPIQIVVAVIEPKESLAATLASLEKAIAARNAATNEP